MNTKPYCDYAWAIVTIACSSRSVWKQVQPIRSFSSGYGGGKRSCRRGKCISHPGISWSQRWQNEAQQFKAICSMSLWQRYKTYEAAVPQFIASVRSVTSQRLQPLTCSNIPVAVPVCWGDFSKLISDVRLIRDYVSVHVLFLLDDYWLLYQAISFAFPPQVQLHPVSVLAIT